VGGGGTFVALILAADTRVKPRRRRLCLINEAAMRRRWWIFSLTVASLLSFIGFYVSILLYERALVATNSHNVLLLINNGSLRNNSQQVALVNSTLIPDAPVFDYEVHWSHFPIGMVCYNRPDYLQVIRSKDNTRILHLSIRGPWIRCLKCAVSSTARLPSFRSSSASIFPLQLARGKDGNMREVTDVARSYVKRFPERIALVQHMRSQGRDEGAAYIAGHYHYILSRVFTETSVHGIILVEDDMIFSADFIEFFEQVCRFASPWGTLIALLPACPSSRK